MAVRRALRASEWDVANAHAALDALLRWRFYEARPFDLLACVASSCVPMRVALLRRLW